MSLNLANTVIAFLKELPFMETTMQVMDCSRVSMVASYASEKDMVSTAKDGGSARCEHGLSAAKNGGSEQPEHTTKGGG